MYLTPEVIDQVVHPTAAFYAPSRTRPHRPPPPPPPRPPPPTDTTTPLTTSSSPSSPSWQKSVQNPKNRIDSLAMPDTSSSTSSPSWLKSVLNPKNRIDSLAMPEPALWRIDGSAGLGTQYYAVPLFFKQAVPAVRMDVFITLPTEADAADERDRIRQQLQLGLALHTRDAAGVSRLAISRHIVRTLQGWVRREFESADAFETFYRAVPFGSRIVLERLSLDPAAIPIRVALNHRLERCLLSVADLSRLWGGVDWLGGAGGPELVDMSAVSVVSLLHDSVSLVRIRGQLFILKALTSEPKYLYHELRNLVCRLGSHPHPHPHIIGRPVHVVLKGCRFGGKQAVLGFTTVYHAGGSLREVLPQRRGRNQLRLEDQVRWARQLAGALAHIRRTSGLYYPDLRLDNIVVTAESDIVMVDFEQRGLWCEFAAPEINAISYVHLMATAACTPDRERDRDRYRAMLARLVPHWQELGAAEYTDPPAGYNIAYIGLSPAEQEAAEVYLLGRVLWCIFEGVSTPQRAAVWQSYGRWEPDIDFPQYRETPAPMRTLIDRCTRGRRAPLSSKIVRQADSLLLPGRPGGGSPADIKAVACQFWRAELRFAFDFLTEREGRKQRGEWRDNCYHRPSLTDVLADLDAFDREVFSGAEAVAAAAAAAYKS